MAENKKDDPSKQIQILYVANKLIIKLFEAGRKEELIFIVLNDILKLFHYDRAFLWEMKEGGAVPLGVSGLPSFNKQTSLFQTLKELIKNIPNPSQGKLLKGDQFSSFLEGLSLNPQAQILWMPIKNEEDKLILGLWLESMELPAPSSPQDLTPEQKLSIFNNFLMPPIAASWAKFSNSFSLGYFFEKLKKRISLWLGLIALSLVLIRVPLRIVAPCEVVPKNPYLVTAPLEGVIEQVKVKPAQIVKKGDLLVEYDKRVPLENLQIAKKEVEILQSEVKRTTALGLNDLKYLAELATYQLKLEKEMYNRNIAEYQASLLDISALIDGVVMIDNPDEWRGRPVKVGEKILQIADTHHTKIKIWIPDNDNILLDPQKDIKIILNVFPEKSFDASMKWISFESSLSDKQIPSFVAEAEWNEIPEDMKLGLKGSAVMYGKNVSLFYYLFRKPWAVFRNFVGF